MIKTVLNIIEKKYILSEISLTDGSFIREKTIADGEKVFINQNVYNYEDGILAYSKNTLNYYDTNFDIILSKNFSNNISSVENITSDINGDTPFYLVKFLDINPRLYHLGFDTYFQLPSELSTSIFYVIKPHPEADNILIANNCRIGSENKLTLYRYKDGPTYLQFYHFWGLIAIPGIVTLILSVSYYLGFILYRRLAFATSLSNTIMKNTGKAICILDPEGIVKAENSEMKTLTGIERNRNYHYKEYFSAGLRIIRESINDSFQYLQKQNNLDFEFYDSRQNRHLNLEVIPLRSWLGRSKGRLISISDLTEHDRIVELDSVQTSVGILSHNVKNLMQSILHGLKINRLSITGQSDYSTAQLESLLDRSLSAGDKVYELSRNLTIMSNIKVNQKEWTNAEIFIKGLFQELYELYQGKIDTEPFKINGYWMLINRKMLKEVIRIIVDNGIQASSVNESLKIIINESEDENENKLLNISIIDQGEGIAEERLEKVFEPSESNKSTGTGLGLYFSYQIVRQHDGMITVQSEVGSGAEFTISLPIYPKPDEEDRPWN